MRIKTVKVQNWCQHRSAEFSFAPGLNGILGRNGSGKSNLLRAIPRALMSRTSCIDVKENDLSWGATDNGKIVVEFEQAGVSYLLQRSVKGSTSSLKWGTEKLTGATAVDDKLRALLGVGARVFNEIVFVAQEDLTSIIFQQPADRMKTFHALLGLDNAERIRTYISDKLSMMPADSCKDMITQLEAKLADTAKELAELSAARLKYVIMPDEEVNKNQRVVSMHQEYLKSSVTNAQVTADIKAIDYEDEVLAHRTNKLTMRADQLNVLLQDTSDYYEDAVAKVALIKAAAAAEDSRTAAQAALESATAVLASIKAPKQEVSPDDLSAAERALNDSRTKLDTVVGILETIQGSAVCPTCDQVIPKSHADKYLSQCDELTAAVSSGTTAVSSMKMRHREYERSLAAYHAKFVQATTMKNQAEITLSKLPSNSIDISELKDNEAIVDNYLSLKQEYTEGSKELREAAARREVIGLRRKALAASKTDVMPQVTDQELRGAQAALERNTAARIEASKLDGRIEALTAVRLGHEESIRELRNRESGLEGIRRSRALLEEARGILHRDCLPAVAARAFLTSLNHSLADHLHSFNAEFAAKINDDLSFDCIFDVNTVSAKRLSGGQKVTLAIATQFALYDLLADNLGILVLDEPSVYLDDDHIDCLAQLLEKVKVRAAASGLQIIVVTHEDRLKSVFDKVIEL